MTVMHSSAPRPQSSLSQRARPDFERAGAITLPRRTNQRLTRLTRRIGLKRCKELQADPSWTGALKIDFGDPMEDRNARRPRR
jgi:hypothetical protein